MSCRIATAIYYDTLSLEELRIVLPALCKAIIACKQLDVVEPDLEPEPTNNSQTDDQDHDYSIIQEEEPEIELIITVDDAAKLYGKYIDSDATVYCSSILAIACAYMLLGCMSFHLMNIIMQLDVVVC